MASEGWEMTTIGALLERDGGSVKTGPFGTVLKSAEYSTDGVPLISVGEVGYGTLEVHPSTPRAPKAVVERLPEYVLNAGDIVFGRKGAVDRSAHVRPDQAGWFLGSDGIRLRVPKTCDSRFVAYHLQSPSIRSWLIQHATGSTMPSLNQNIIERIPIALPPIQQQRRIADILGALDDRLEVNRHVSQTLEWMARALFKSWFVDFDPVRAKAEGRDAGLPSRLVDVFPDAFDESEVGEIPREWRVGGLDEIADFLNGLALQRFPPGEGPALPIIKISQLHAGNTDGADRASADIPSEYVVQDGDVLFSWSGSLTVEVWSGGPGALNQHLFKVTSTRWPKWFYYLWTCQHLGDFSDIAAGKATTMGHIQRHHLSDAKVVVPPPHVMEAADTVFGPITEASWRIGVQSRNIAAMRDSLLPVLLGGELGARLGGSVATESDA